MYLYISLLYIPTYNENMAHQKQNIFCYLTFIKGFKAKVSLKVAYTRTYVCIHFFFKYFFIAYYHQLLHFGHFNITSKLLNKFVSYF